MGALPAGGPNARTARVGAIVKPLIRAQASLARGVDVEDDPAAAAEADDGHASSDQPSGDVSPTPV
jgi:hypothetical protein